ncbi:MAG: hypothetical protein JJD98_00085 [Polaromonas sp.]|nr:hypothetical protein [Polaromonas sp.]
MIEEVIEHVPAQRWQIDKSIPLALIMAFVFQTLAGTWWMSTFSERTTNKIESLEKRQLLLDTLPERIARQEAQLSAVADGVQGLRNDVRDLANRRTAP